MTIQVLTQEELDGLDIVIDNGAVVSASITIPDPIEANIVCLGDSNTEGYRVLPEERYPLLLSAVDGIGTAHNEGVSEQRVIDVVDRLQTSLYDKKVVGARNIVTVLVGTGDFLYPDRPALQAWSDMQTLIAGAKADGWEIWIMTYFQNLPERTSRIKELNTYILNNESLGYTAIDIYPQFVDANDVLLPGLIRTEDGLHLTALGTQKIFNNLETMFNIGFIDYVSSFFHTKAIDFDGTTEYMLNNTDQAIGIANAWSTETWVDYTDLIGQQVLFNIRAVALNNAIACYTDPTVPTNMVINIFDSAGTVFKAYTLLSTLSTGTKYAIGFSWDGTSLKCYINGTEITSLTKTTDIAGTMTDTNRKLSLGANYAGSLPTNCKISKHTLWNTALSGAAFTSLYDSGNGYKLDARNSIGSYTATANLKHQYALGKDTGSNIGADYVSSGNINISDNSANITDADIVTF